MIRKLSFAGVMGLCVMSAATAAPIALEGNFVRVGISDFGTLGSNGNAPPGILHDPTGTRNFAPGGIPNDYLTPGSPSEGFAVNSRQTGFRQNNNNGVSNFGLTAPTLLAGAAKEGFDSAASWTGGLAGLLTIRNDYFFNDGDERITIRTTITALADLTDLAFGRHLDPDPDVNRFSSFSTRNTRGNALFGPEVLVSAAGLNTGLTIGLLNLTPEYVSNTGISGFCCSITDPNIVLGGFGPISPLFNDGDLGLQMAWRIGDLGQGESAVIRYAYVMGDKQETVGGGGGSTPVPEPASLVVFGLGLAGLVAARRRRTH